MLRRRERNRLGGQTGHPIVGSKTELIADFEKLGYVQARGRIGVIGGLKMWDHLKVFFDTTMLSPHGICLLWEPELLIVHVVSDTIIALSYFSIPFALAYFVFKRRDVEFGWIFWAFAIFIMACGFTDVFSI